MNLLVTGDKGFVGSHVLKLIGGTGLTELCENADLLNIKPVIAAIGEFRPDAILHLAGITNIPQSFDEPMQTYQTNFIAVHHLLEGLKSIDFKGRLLFVGSGDIYGKVASEKMPITEDLPLKPRSPYAVSKVAAEALCFQWSQTEKMHIVLARPFNHTGPGQDIRFVISGFARQMAEISMRQRPPVVEVGDIDAGRDFTDVRDVVRAYQMLLERGSRGEVYNICSGQGRTIREALFFMSKYLGVEVEIKVDEKRIRPSEQKMVIGCNEKIVAATGWTPQIPFEQSIIDTIEYWREYLNG